MSTLDGVMGCPGAWRADDQRRGTRLAPERLLPSGHARAASGVGEGHNTGTALHERVVDWSAWVPARGAAVLQHGAGCIGIKEICGLQALSRQAASQPQSGCPNCRLLPCSNDCSVEQLQGTHMYEFMTIPNRNTKMLLWMIGEQSGELVAGCACGMCCA